MKKPNQLLILLLVLLLPLVSGAEERPNIVLIFTDDQGIHDVGAYGSEIPTPNIDKIGAEGIKFENWYSASSICTPSRFGLLTGKNPSRSQSQLLSALMFMGEEDKTRGLQKGETTIAHVLRNQGGYQTALIGKWHLGHGDPAFLPVNHGFDRFIGHTGGCIDFFTMTYGIIPDWYHQTKHVTENGYATELITEEAVAYIASQAKRKRDPFFLYLAYNAPHFGKAWSPSDRKPVNLMQPQGDDLKRVAFIKDKIRREFAAMVTSLDDGVGKVLEAVDTNGLTENTLLIFLTDHGGDPVYGGSNKPYRGDKATLFEGGLRVPCMMRWPGKIKAETTSDAVLGSLDIFPTLCHLGGIDPDPLKPDGVDILDHLLGGKAPESREFFWETGKHAELERGTWRALRSGKWKYVQSPTEGDFLFDIASDPHEKADLSKSHPEVFNRLQKKAISLAESFRKE